MRFFSNQIFFKKKIFFFDRIFFKFISWSRRIVLKRFQYDSGSLKRITVTRKNVDRRNLSRFCYLSGAWDPEVWDPDMKKSKSKKNQQKNSSRKRKLFLKLFFLIVCIRSIYGLEIVYTPVYGRIRAIYTKTNLHGLNSQS